MITMRTIKFKGYEKGSGLWRYGSLLVDGEKYYIAQIIQGKLVKWLVDPNSVGKFTGLQDCKGNDIYEGDIVECVSWNEYFSKDGQPMEPFRRKMYVDFRRGGFKMVEPMPEPMKDNEWDIICNGDIVIIGNIYDDELLKGGEQ